MLKNTLFTLLLLLVFTAAKSQEVKCPPNKIGPSPFTPVTEVIGQIEVKTHFAVDLGEHAINAEGWNFRARSILFGKGAQGPVHSHDRRPEFVMVKHGSIVLHDTNCMEPITLYEGQVYHAGIGNEHWGVNATDQAVVVYIVDILDDEELGN